jgi:hypothetical protein
VHKINAKEKDGTTPLFYANYGNHKDVAEILIANGAISSGVQNICIIDKLPKSCTIGGHHFIFDFTISRDKGEKNYSLKGIVKHKGEFSHLQTEKSDFYLILINKGKVIGKKRIFFKENQLQSDIPFKKTFSSEPFDVIGISYKVLLRD